MNKTVKLDMPRSASERMIEENNSIWGLIKRIEARASDGRYYHMEDADREQAVILLKKLAASSDKEMKKIGFAGQS